ncbi:hypothetical protein NXH67_03220 [Butyrivibrio sp. DSM 10294]|uniref:ATP-binding protein n=1 Tax=Butyrivibrio sp. DSM 10294 TaxID=2972457 RepID=UPI00234F92F5|nr:SbcC/MukB-like Walker B domain-containing protein [Butyrivibrio sp. DSM 10294]MDC7292524.1 hypothetical protein [Butyrivibrio sp. DSM 10294]
MTSNRKVATGLQLINWSRFTNVRMKLEGSTLITGNNGTGKSTVLDAITYLLTGNTHFNIAAKDRDRSVAAYVRGDTHSEGTGRYLRGNMDVVSYIAMEFYSPLDKANMVVFVTIELKKDESRANSYWYVAKDASLSDIVFSEEKDGKLSVYPKSQITIKGQHISSKEFMGMERGTKQVLQAMGLRCEVSKYKSKIIKMLSFDPQKNIDKFIQECVLEEGEMSSLADLKEQRANYEEIRQTYDDMLESKKVLEHIEDCTREYEQKYSDYNKRRLVLGYQKWQSAVQAIEKLKSAKGQEEAGLAFLIDKKEKKDKELEEARQKLEELNSSSDYQDISSTLKRFEDQIVRLTKERDLLSKSVKEVEALQGWIDRTMQDYSEELQLNLDVKDELTTISSKGDTTKKVAAFYAFSEEIKRICELKKLAQLRNMDQIEKDNDSLAQKLDEKKQLEGNKLVFEPGYEKTRSLISDELKKQNISTDVKFFVELITEVKDKKWRRAIETFMGGKRFNIIVDPKYTVQVLKIVNDNPAPKGKVVIADKLEATEIVAGSAAEQLEIINPTARMYANYLLNGIHLCETVDELHEYPKGAIMPNGMLAKSYAVGKMQINGTKLFIGQDAIKLQIEDLGKEIHELVESIRERSAINESLEAEITGLQEKSLNQDDYDFEAVNEYDAVKDSLRAAKSEKENYEKDPSLTAMLEAFSKAKANHQRIEEEIHALYKNIGGSEKEIERIQKDISSKEQLRDSAQKEFELECREMPELRQPAIEMYNQQIQKKDTVITEKTVREWERELDKAKKDLEDAHLQYCRINGTDNQMRGVSFIGYYREQYRNLANVQIEEAKQKLEKQGEKLQSAFVGDFVAEINETIRGAKEEIDKINKELKGRPFGNDVYQFEMKERLDSEGKALFFKICKQMHEYFDNAEYYLNVIKDDEDSEHDIKEFIDIVLNEEDETEYTDYRKYFTYDMRIISKQGEDEVQATLSKKQGSASNGEKQTPYFIILAASLLQLYPKDRSSARLAFIDEAFSALSRERIEQMVDYLETNDFQVVYAAPPDKINSIGSHIQTTITLVPKGRQSFAVEGLLKNLEE